MPAEGLQRVCKILSRPQGAVYPIASPPRSPINSPSLLRRMPPGGLSAVGVQGVAREPLSAGASRSGSSWRWPRS